MSNALSPKYQVLAHAAHLAASLTDDIRLPFWSLREKRMLRAARRSGITVATASQLEIRHFWWPRARGSG